MRDFLNTKDYSIENLQQISIDLSKKLKCTELDVLMCTYKDNQTVVYQISPYEDFNIIQRKVKIDETAIWTAGIKTEECLDVAYENIINQKNILEIYKNTFDAISFEGIGGDLIVYQIDKNISEEKYKISIQEKDNLNTVKEILENQHLIVAEKVVGRLILGTNVIISDPEGEFEIKGNKLTIKDNSPTKKTRVVLGEYVDNEYGLELFGESGAVIVNSHGLMQTDTIQVVDNVDPSHRLKLKIYIPQEVLEIRKVTLNFSLEHFRAYETSVVGGSGGGSSVTSSSGGSTTVTSAETGLTLNNLSNTYTHGIKYTGVPGDTTAHEHDMGQRLVA
jgi:hypothetical protein